ncbi:MAG TPA: STAS domain-containing protein [Solirubrobacteraceae bacterium]|jgi:anti-sigma B factor antagonist|nr:STAS domain-containing protein [Solirubrobacteraceae bacterium]
MPNDFELTHETVPGGQLVAVRGEIDLFSAPELKQRLTALIDGGAQAIVVDLSETTFLDSTALGVLIGAVKRLRTKDGRMVIVNVDSSIAKIFEITGLDQIFDIQPTRQEATAALGASPSPD